MNNLIKATSSLMRQDEHTKMITTARAVFALGSSEVDEAALEYNLKNIITTGQRDAFFSFAESELTYMQREDELKRFQKNTRLEKFNIVCRKFNQEIRLAEKDNVKVNLIPVKLSAEEQFYTSLKGKLTGSLRNMRALRDMAAVKREYHKMIHLKDMMSLGLDETDFSILSMAITRVIEKGENRGFSKDQKSPEKNEADVFIALMQDGGMKKVISDEVNVRLLSLAKRRDAINAMVSDRKTEALMRIDISMEDMETRKETIFSKLETVYAYVYSNRTKDWSTIKTWDAFMLIRDDGTKTKAFSDKEIKALEMMGGWDNVIKIVDQDRLEREVSKVFKIAREERAIQKAEGVMSQSQIDATRAMRNITASKKM